MTVRSLHHVGILVDDFADVRRVLRDCLGVEVREPDPQPQLGIEILWAEVGGTALEFIRPLDPAGRAAEVLRSGRGGVHHVAFRVDDLDAALATVKAAGIAVLDETPRAGVHGSRIAFIDPAAAGGTLIELVEPAQPSGTSD